MRYAIIGAGISGLSAARMLKDLGHEVTVYEKDSKVGGLVKCRTVEGNLYHMVGGHVFNSKRKDVLDWFWGNFNRESEFVAATRNAVINLDGEHEVSYPIENHLSQLPERYRNSIIAELLELYKSEWKQPETLGEFFRSRFGSTLNEIYFTPYNNKIWQKDVDSIPLSWLDGKLPMPSIEEIFTANIAGVQERNMVHSTFFYPLTGGSQFLADRLASGLDIRLNSSPGSVEFDTNARTWTIDCEIFDRIIYTANIKHLHNLLPAINIPESLRSKLEMLDYHGTTSVLCKVKTNDFSWIYIPDKDLKSHRIICTGNFSATNNAGEALTATVEFSCKLNKEQILGELSKMPYNPQYIAHHWQECTYPISEPDTAALIDSIKQISEANNVFLLGRFAEWQYYNMDAAIGAAIDLVNQINR